RYGRPEAGVHAVQMELACRGYIDEPAVLTPDNWPTPYAPARAAPLLAALADVLKACLAYADSA
ncbi:MAG TPA: N-formylglutamate deformylase, partial [Caulobacter sp.]|nr:N-formylglutamate deformylase [Caulobacter sp.]